MGKPKKEVKKIRITHLDDTKEVVGELDEGSKIFSMKLSRAKDFRPKFNGWGIDSKVLDLLASQNATIQLTDKDSKWIYQCEAVDMKCYGQLEERPNQREKVYLDLNYWKVVKARDRSCVIQCLEEDCSYNFGKQCLRGAIEIGIQGECNSYEDRN